MAEGDTPWGQSDCSEKIAEGITWYSTPSHGGYKLSRARLAEMPEWLLACPFRPVEQAAGWFEEDCDWARVVLAFPEYFPPALVVSAEESLRRWCHGVFEAV